MFALLAVVAALQLTAVDNGRAYTVAPQRAIVITLASNPSTGYRWSLRPQTVHGVVRFVTARFRPSHKNMPGTPGKEVWRFVAVGKGRTTLSLVYSRPWERDHPVRRFGVTIRVR